MNKRMPEAFVRGLLRAFACAAVVLSLSSCGGGGGGGSDCAGTTVYDSYGYNTDAHAVSGEIGEPISLTLVAHVQIGCKLSNRLEGTLPPGLRFDAASGAITGTPTAGGVYDVTVRPDAANSEVAEPVRFTIQPLGRQSVALAPLELNAPTFSDNRIGSRVAVADSGGVTRLWIGSWSSSNGESFRVYRSTDDGVTWSGDTTGGVITTRGDTIGDFLLAAAADKAYVLEAGADVQLVPVPNALYRYDGSRWALRNDTLPFIAPRGAAMQALPDGRIGVAWSDSDGVTLWTSADEGLTWTRRNATGGVTPGPGEDGAICLGAAGADWQVVTAGSNAFDHSRLAAGATAWTTPVWPWGSYAERFGVCASDGTRFWLLGQPVSSADQYLMLMDAVEGEATLAYPRRVRSMGQTSAQHFFDSMAASDGALYGLLVEQVGAGFRYRLWALR